MPQNRQTLTDRQFTNLKARAERARNGRDCEGCALLESKLSYYVKKEPGRKPKGEKPMTARERVKAYRERQKKSRIAK